MAIAHPELAATRVLAILSRNHKDSQAEYRGLIGQVFPHLDMVCPEDLDDLAAVVRSSAQTHGLVLAIGGDGTLHQVLQHIEPHRQSIGILPAGTGNDFARVLAFPQSLKERVSHLAKLRLQSTDYGSVNGLRYHNSAGFGLDSETLRRRERIRGPLRSNYTAVFLLTLAGLRCDRIRVQYGTEQQRGSFYWVLCMNTPYIGGGTKIAPRAAIDDGKLDMVLIRETGKLNLLRYLPKAIKGEHLNLPMTVHAQVDCVSCVCEQPLEYIALDGELYKWGRREIEFRANPGGLSFLR
jgi:diacylglycerol kinase (ATP)